MWKSLDRMWMPLRFEMAAQNIIKNNMAMNKV